MRDEPFNDLVDGMMQDQRKALRDIMEEEWVTCEICDLRLAKDDAVKDEELAHGWHCEDCWEKILDGRLGVKSVEDERWNPVEEWRVDL